MRGDEGDGVMDIEQWSPQAGERFGAALQGLTEAVRRHGEALLAMEGRRAELPQVFAANEALGRVAVAFNDALLDLSGTSVPWAWEADLEDDQEDNGEDVQEVARFSVVRRADYQVTDLDQVLAAGRDAYRQVWPQDTEEDAAVEITQLGQAVYEVVHAGGLDAVDELSGVVPAGATTWIVEAPQLLAELQRDGDLPEDPFAGVTGSDANVLHRLDEIVGS